MIVCEFGEGNVLGPRCGIRSAKDPKIGLDFLVDALSFAVSLGVVCGGEGKFIAEEFSEFFGEGRGKLWSSVGDDFVIETKSFEDLFREESCYS